MIMFLGPIVLSMKPSSKIEVYAKMEGFLSLVWRNNYATIVFFYYIILF